MTDLQTCTLQWPSSRLHSFFEMLETDRAVTGRKCNGPGRAEEQNLENGPGRAGPWSHRAEPGRAEKFRPVQTSGPRVDNDNTDTA